MSEHPKIQQFTQAKQAEFDVLQKEYNLNTYKNENVGWSELEKEQKIRELGNLNKRISDACEKIMQDLNKDQEDLLAPIRARVQNAIDAVGRANGYDVITDAQVCYKGKAFYELQNKVKNKLGIRR